MTEMTHQGSYDEDFFGARHAFRGQARAQTWTCVVTLHARAQSLLTTGAQGTTTPKQAASVRVDQALTQPRSRDNGHPGVGSLEPPRTKSMTHVVEAAAGYKLKTG